MKSAQLRITESEPLPHLEYEAKQRHWSLCEDQARLEPLEYAALPIWAASSSHAFPFPFCATSSLEIEMHYLYNARWNHKTMKEAIIKYADPSGSLPV
jgi:hypothetical protein